MSNDQPGACPLTDEICAFVANTPLDAIPPQAQERGRVHLLDTLGLALSGSNDPATRIVRRQAERLSTSGTASILGTSLKTAPSLAALVNGTSMHVDNFDDTSPQPSPDRNGGIHASAGTLPAALAIAEDRSLSGRALVEAFHMGMEVACKLNHAIDQRHYAGGFHTTGTLGIFGATAAAARLLGLDVAGIGHALAIATARAGGLRANFGSMTEQAHAGFAAEGGVVAAELAADGLTGGPNIIEGKFGLFEAAGGGYLPDAIHNRLGAPWAITDPGAWIKPYPSGSLTHPAMTLLTDLMAKHGFTAKTVQSVRVTTNPRLASTLIHNRPNDAKQARFSMPFCLAVLLVEGRAGLPEFTDTVVNRPDIKDMIGRITYDTYDTVEPGYSNVTSFIEVTTTDGTRHNGRADFARGSTEAPMSYEDVAEKFEGCAAAVDWPADKVREIIDLVARL
ncbi:MAG: MmgE/PrpD family protein, partial [Rhodospirillaceae bacterium]|nr:MmgE/PrpD family protein [Rhodospirillaceae bacterium]